MSDLPLLYDSTRRVAARMSRWQLRWAAWRVHRALRKDPLDQRAQVRRVAYESELVKRGVASRAPRTDSPFHRLA